MAGPPPPPPPPPPGPGSLSNLPPGPPASMPPGRDALLGDIRKGTKLKKAQTIDKSKPVVGGASSSGVSASPAAKSSGSLGAATGASAPVAAPSGIPQLGDLFAGGMPKLKSVNKHDNRSGVIPPSAPKLPTISARKSDSGGGSAPPPIPAAPAPALGQESKAKAPQIPSSRPSTKTAPSSKLGEKPAVPAPPVPGLNSSTSSKAPAAPKAPKMPPSRPKKSLHLKDNSISSINSFESTPEAPTLPSASAPPVPALPNSVPPPIPGAGKKDSSSSSTPAPPPLPSSNAPPAPPVPKAPSAPPAPPAPPAPSTLAGNATLKSRSDNKLNSSSGLPPPGGLPFLAEINAKRDDTHVVDSVNSKPTTNSSSKFHESPQKTQKESRGFSLGHKPRISVPKSSSSSAPPAPPAVPAVPSPSKPTAKAPHTPPPVPTTHSKTSGAPDTSTSETKSQRLPGNAAFLNEIVNRNHAKADTGAVLGFKTPDHSLPATPPPVPPNISAPSVNSEQEPASRLPRPAMSLFSKDTQQGSPSAPPPLPPSFAPASPTPKPPAAPTSSATPSTPPQPSRHKKAAPPPPPPTTGSKPTSLPSNLNLQQTAGESLRQISALAYTIDTFHLKGNGSESKAKVVIEDREKRFKFVNANSLPNPRRFGEDGGKVKLYPSGRGSSVPLDLSLFT